MTDRSMIFLNSMGDIEIVWDKENDEDMKKLIQKKMGEGITFFIMEERFFGLSKRKKKIKSLSELGSSRIRVDDGDLEALFGAGKASVYRGEGNVIHLDTVRTAKNADDVVNNKTVAVRAFAGG